MDDIEVWLRTDLVRLDFYIWCVGCGKAGVLLRTGLGACGRGSTSSMVGWRREAREAHKAHLPFQLVDLVVQAPGTASQPHSSVEMRAGRSLQCLTLVGTGGPSSKHLERTLNPCRFLLNGRGVCLSGSSAWLFFVSCCFCFEGGGYFCVLVFFFSFPFFPPVGD